MEDLSVEKRKPPLTTIFLWIAGAVTLVLTGYGVFTGVVLTMPFPYNILIVINSAMIGIVEIFVGGDWIKYDYTVTDAPSGTPNPTWMKVEFLSVEGTTVSVQRHTTT